MAIQDQLPLAPRDLLILAVLAEGPHHGYGIIKAVEARSGSGVHLDPANLYRVLRRMRQVGWIREAEEEPAGPGGGEARGAEIGPGGRRATIPPTEARTSVPRRRTYEITPVGANLLSEELVRLEQLLRQVRPALAGKDGR